MFYLINEQVFIRKHKYKDVWRVHHGQLRKNLKTIWVVRVKTKKNCKSAYDPINREAHLQSIEKNIKLLNCDVCGSNNIESVDKN